MSSNAESPREEALDDVLEEQLDSGKDDETYSVPLEADPADIAEQHQRIGGEDEDDYR